MATKTAPSLNEIKEARARLEGVARVTPVYGSETLSRRVGREVVLKAENLQRTGSFKIRGAVNKIATLSEPEKRAGVVAASAGNHGQAVAWAAREEGAKATVFMPQDAPMAKVEPTKNYGAKAELVGAAFEESLAAARTFAEETGATFVHPYEDEKVIAGQGTIGLELADQVPQAETVVIPVGGGGLASGIALALRAARPGIRIVGVQAGLKGPTIADGIAVKEVGDQTGRILEDVLDDLVSVSDDEICQAILLLLERSKLVVEGAGAVGVAALLGGQVTPAESGTTVAVLSGGNVDPGLLASVARRHETEAGRRLVVLTRVPDRPGALASLLACVASTGANLVDVSHVREGLDLHVRETAVEMVLETRGHDHAQRVMAALRDGGYATQVIR
jgi:threonine dehydratase